MDPSWPANLTPRLEELYRDLHRHPELSFQERRTAEIVTAWVRGLGYEVHERIGGTGVAAVLANGDGPVIALRADMDALPVLEATGLEYASTARATDAAGAEVPVMHACGHDMHVTCLLGAAATLASTRAQWAGTLVLLFQPAEETAQGAQAMLDDRLYDRVPRPHVVLGQHVAPLPAGYLGLRPGPSWAASDSLRITLHGAGGHGSRPETTVDPVLLAASTVQRLHTIVSREVPAADTAVLTVGASRSGTKANIIPDSAELLVNIRSYTPEVRNRVLTALQRVVAGEAAAAGTPRPPEIEHLESAPTLTNDPAATERTVAALEQVVGPGHVVDHGPLPSSEDVPHLADAVDAPLTFWLLGGADPALFATARSAEDVRAITAIQPSNHSPSYAPVLQPTITIGVRALTAAARAWLAGPA
ncbi:amidohydrolase [Phycicoccus avicenniae]|uniref:amidohydrolase n=1 Tax=Phycicoccus avicenniae TaxID=2828860 RepID=UPI003D2819BF